MTEHVDGRFTGAGGGQIFWQGWIPGEAARGVVVIAHGFAEHSRRYEHVGERLAADGYATYALDHRGHGRSDGERGSINRMSEVCDDVGRLVQLAGGRHDGVPQYLLGHSLGGLIALDFVTSRGASGLRGLILSGAAVDPSVGSTVERLAARLLSAVAPNLGLVPALDAAAMSRDPAVVSAYENDPLNYRGKICARVGGEGLAAIARVTAGLRDIELPILVMHGTADQLSASSGSQLVADGVASDDVTLKLYDGLYHEIFNEPERETVLGDLLDWLEKHP